MKVQIKGERTFRRKVGYTAVMTALATMGLWSAGALAGCDNVTEGLVACYPFEGNANDESGNGHNGVVQGNLNYADSTSSKSAYFNGTTKVLFPTLTSSYFSGDFSISFYLKPQTTNIGSVLAKRTSCVAGNFFDIRGGNSYIGFETYTLTPRVTSSPNGQIVSNQWNLVTMMRKGTNAVVYINGQMTDQKTAGSILNNTAVFGISNSPCVGVDGSGMLKGELDDLRIYDRALSTTEIKQLYGKETLTVTKSGYGNVTATGINCGSDCKEEYVKDSTVTLTAIPSTYATFNEWSGDCAAAGTQPIANVTLDTAKNCVATFSTTLTNPTNGHVYQLINQGMTWVAGRDYCASQGGYLTTITTQSEQDFVYNNLCAGNFYCLLGGTNDGQVGKWRWITNEAWGYTHWNPGEPNNAWGNETISGMYGINASNGGRASFWNDSPSSTGGLPICEWDTPKVALAVTKTGYGNVVATGINCGKDCAEEYAKDSTVTLTAIPITHATFDGWSGDCAGTDVTINVTLNTAKKCVATFSSTLDYPFNEGTDLTLSFEEDLFIALGFPTTDGLTVELGTPPAHGELLEQTDVSYQYLADNLHCSDNFTYRVCSSQNCSAYQSANITTERADLVLSQLQYHKEDSAKITVQIDNLGIEPSADTRISFYQFDAEQGGTLLGTVPVNALAPNQQDTVIFNAGNLQEPLNIYATIDAENQLDECNKINNFITLFSSETEGVTPASCEIYGMDDLEQNNSQLFSLRVKSSFKEFEHNQLATCIGCDLETLTSHPQTRVLYTASGDNTAIGRPKGHLYRVDAKIGTFLPVGSTGFDDIEGLAFSADGILYGYAKGQGIIEIDSQSGKGKLVVPSAVKVEGFTLDNETPDIFYGAVDKDLWQFDRTAKEPLQTVCDNLPGEVESLRMLSKEVVLLGIHNREGLQAFNVKSCQLSKEAYTPTFENKDVEGVTLVGSGCATLSRLLSLAHGLSSHFLHPFIVSLYDEGVVGYETELPFLLAGGKEITFLPFEKREILFTHPTDQAVPSDKSPGIIADNGKFTWVFANEQGQMLEQPLYQVQITDTDEIEKLFRAVPNFKKLVIHSDGNAYYTIGRSVYHSAFDMAGGIRKPDPDAPKVDKNEINWAKDVNGDGVEDVEFTYHDGSKQNFFMFGKIGEVKE